jgi:cyclopropane fatty-acyl-phospholipid synthase-like methyltransferase
MSSNSAYWRQFWEGKTSPLHRFNTAEWYHRYAQEINLILDALNYQGGSVLETGCGNGALFDSLAINKEDYVGTDISNSLIDKFQASHPKLKLLCTDSASYYEERKFSLIFSNGVIQYFDRKQLDVYVNNSLKMLDSSGILLMVNVPDRDSRHKFQSINSSFIQKVYQEAKVTLFELSGRPSIGCWYSVKDFNSYLGEGLEMQIFGSLFHPYRFSLALKKIS